MRIIEMTATFGKLDGQTLRLEPGMNWIVAPNEWGKSTWCAFLTAMLYGIDTRERSGRDSLADKEHYAPWSGKPMEGSIRLMHEGQDITIQRRTKGRVPLGAFSAFETESGLPVRELTAENCGQVLLGVERSVFQRSGFIRLQEMPVTQDEALRRRLNALVTTADESDAADQLAQKLRDLKNRCRYNRSGLIPQTRQRLEELNAQLQQRQALDSRLVSLREKELETEELVSRLECHRQWLQYHQSRQNEEHLEKALESEKAAALKLKEQKERCQSHLPRRELEELLEQPQTVEQTGSGTVFLILAVLAVVAAGVLAWQGHFIFGALAAVVGLALGFLWYSGRREAQKLLQLKQTQSEKRQQWRQALADWDELEHTRQEALQAKNHADTLRSMVHTAQRPTQEDTLNLTQEDTDSQLASARNRLSQYRQMRSETTGRMESLPQAQSIQRQIEQTGSRLKELELTYTALGYAQKALEEATQTLQKRFSPKITHRAQYLLSRLTDGRYDQLSLSEDLTLTAAASDEVTQRSRLWRSDGTADQMYLALRLAVWEELTPGAPLVLDDALVRFDVKRLAAARELLEELAQEHQVIVFTCK